MQQLTYHINTAHSTYHHGMLSLGVALMCSFSLLNWTGLASMLTICNSIWFGHGSGHWKAEQKALLLGLFIIITFNWGISWLQSYCVQCYAFVNTLTKAVQVPWWEHDVWIVLLHAAPASTLHPRYSRAHSIAWLEEINWICFVFSSVFQWRSIVK